MSQHQLEMVVDMLARVATTSASQQTQMKETLDMLARRNTSETGMWSRFVGKPDIFHPKDREEELSQFPEWAWQFKQYLRVVSPSIHGLVEGVEAELDEECDHESMVDEAVEHSKTLYALLSSLLRERPVQILKAIPDGNGCEVWRMSGRWLHLRSQDR